VTLGFSGMLQIKAWLTTLASVLLLLQVATALRMWGRLPGVSAAAPGWVALAHRWSGTTAFVLTLAVALHCIFALGFAAGDHRVTVPSLELVTSAAALPIARHALASETAVNISPAVLAGGTAELPGIGDLVIHPIPPIPAVRTRPRAPRSNETAIEAPCQLRCSGVDGTVVPWMGQLALPEALLPRRPGESADWHVVVEKWERMGADPSPVGLPRVQSRVVYADHFWL